MAVTSCAHQQLWKCEPTIADAPLWNVRRASVFPRNLANLAALKERSFLFASLNAYSISTFRLFLRSQARKATRACRAGRLADSADAFVGCPPDAAFAEPAANVVPALAPAVDAEMLAQYAAASGGAGVVVRDCSVGVLDDPASGHAALAVNGQEQRWLEEKRDHLR